MKRARKISLILIFLIFIFGCTLVEVKVGPGYGNLQEVTLEGKGKDKILLVDISGFISTRRRGTPLSPRPSLVEEVKTELELAKKDKHVKGLLLRINSPGGTVTACDIIYHEIRELERQKKMPVVASMMSLATSGAYYIALSGDEIIAHPTSITGAVGVIALKLDIEGLLKKVGVRVEVYKSGPEKDSWSPFRPSTEEEKRHIEEMIKGLSDRFVALVKERRRLGQGTLSKVTSGRIFTAQQAHEIGLIDREGYLSDAFKRAKSLAGLKMARLVSYSREGKGAQANIYSYKEAGKGISDALLVGEAAYLWLPW